MSFQCSVDMFVYIKAQTLILATHCPASCILFLLLWRIYFPCSSSDILLPIFCDFIFRYSLIIQPFNLQPLNLCFVSSHSIFFFIDTSSDMRAINNSFPFSLYILAFFSKEMRASVVTPGDASIELSQPRIVVGCGKLFQKTELTYLYHMSLVLKPLTVQCPGHKCSSLSMIILPQRHRHALYGFMHLSVVHLAANDTRLEQKFKNN